MKQRFPFSPHPVGWFVVAYSDEPRWGAVLPLSYFGTELVAFRGDDGVARVLDAFCPHLGAHLGHGGVVEGAAIRCPFHHWCFDGAGVCTKIPYAKKSPPAARRASRRGPCARRTGSSSRGITLRTPTLRGSCPRSPRWTTRRGRHSTGGGGRSGRTSTRWSRTRSTRRTSGTCTRCTTSLRPRSSSRAPFSRLTSKTVMDTPFGTGIEGMLDIHSYGFGTARFTGLIETLLVTTITPIDEYVDARFSFTVKKLPDESATTLVGKGFVDELCRQVEQDIPIWEKKTFFERPLLCDGDGPIGSFRKWARQYYPEGAPTAGRARRALRVAE